MRLVYQLLAVACFSLLSACSTTPKETATSVPEPSSRPTTESKPAVASESEMQQQDRMIKMLGVKSIYFDYDKYSVKTEYQDVIRQDYEFLKTAPTVSVALQGNADERGSTEYNLALGQKRAEAVKRELKLLGISEDRLEAVSFGEEKPRATCHEEKCWSENRRVDLAFARKP